MARLGLAQATATDRRELSETLQLWGAVYADPEAVPLAEAAPFRVEWDGAVPLRHHAIRSSQAMPS